jgi:hypothetical protein
VAREEQLPVLSAADSSIELEEVLEAGIDISA